MSDLSDKLGELGDKFKEIANDLKDLPDEWQQMNDACQEWLSDPENVSKGVAWARKTAGVMKTVGKSAASILPESMGDDLKKMLTGLFEAIPNYVDALTSLLVDRVGAVDKAAGAGTVSYLGGECTNGSLDENDLKLIDGLDLGDAEKGAIFRAACHYGMATGFKNYLQQRG